MIVSVEILSPVISAAKRILGHHEELKRLRGDGFNIFSILKMDHYENETHSAFLGELLNPKGSHSKKSIFLRLFLDLVSYKGNLDVDNASVVLEKDIGSVDHDRKTGGRIDIYIFDHSGNSISLENKIYAGDQDNQIARYVNHNKEKNTVYYLTLEGEQASASSKRDLEEERDYFVISYRSTILYWLQQCHKESVDSPILRETISQYINLIKKLTNQLDDSKMKDEIEELIKNNYTASKALVAHVQNVEVKITHTLLSEMKDLIEAELGHGWHVSVDSDLSQPWTGLHIKRDDWNDMEVKLEGYSKMPWGNNYYGIVAPDFKYDRSIVVKKLSSITMLHGVFKTSKHWPYYQYVLDLSNDEKREKLFEPESRRKIVNDVSRKLIELAQLCKEPLTGIDKIQG
jgi:hypothetical protein